MDALQQARLEFKKQYSLIAQMEPGLSREEHAKMVPMELKIKEIEIRNEYSV
jgi:hypothetical protein